MIQLDSRFLPKKLASNLLQKFIPEIRKRIFSTYGVETPTVHWSEYDADDSELLGYRLLVNGVPRVTNYVQRNRRLFVGSVEELRARGVVGLEALRPDGVGSAYWISEPDWKKVDEFNLWELAEYPVGLTTAGS